MCKLMLSTAFAVCMFHSTWAEPYEVTVPSGTTNVIDEAFVTALGSSEALVKKGAGALNSSSALASYTGEIRVEEGVFIVTENGSLGTKAGHTVVSNNATLLLDIATYNTYTDAGETVYISGDGAEGYDGVIVNNGARQPYMFYGGSGYTGGGIVLNGDAAISRTTTGNSYDIRHSTLTMNGHTLAIEMGSRSYSFYVVRTRVKEPGNIEVNSGLLVIEGIWNTTWDGSETNTLTVKNGAGVRRIESNAYIPWTLNLNGGARYDITKDKYGFSSGPEYYRWDGPFHTGGWCLYDGNAGTRMLFAGPVSGTGPLYFTAGWLRLENPNNSYTGQTYFNGQGGTYTGGVVICANGALPKNSIGALIQRGDLVFDTGDRLDLPEVEFNYYGNIIGGRGVMTGLKKNHDGLLDITGTFSITGRTEIAGGSVRIAKMPLGKPGLLRSLDTSENSGFSAGKMFWWQSYGYTYPFQDYVVTGPEMLEQNGKYIWPMDSAVQYTGYVWNHSSENVTWNFYAYINQGMRILVDNSERIINYNSLGYKIGDAFTLAPGSHKLEVLAYCYANTTAGGLKNGAFPVGIGYDPLGRAESNAVNYVAFKDPGDGSLFTQDVTPTAGLDPEEWRTTFADLKMAEGTLLDLNDRNEIAVVKKFSGKGVFTNGVLKITEKWLVTPSDLPNALVIQDGDLVLSETAMIDLGDLSGFTMSSEGVVIGKVDGTITGLDRFAKPSERWRISVTGQGDILLKYVAPGSIIILR
ncbi:MAG: hypothetical protein WC340_06525 [Kiritimatiellia bacterium]